MSFVRNVLVWVVAIGVVSSAGLVVRAEEQKEAGKEEKAKAKPVDFRKLKELLPAEIAGIKRTKAEGQKTSLGEFTLSTATGTYDKGANDEKAGVQKKEGDDSSPPRVTITLNDYAGTTGIAEAATAWTKLDIDNESDDGYSKTRKIGDYPAFEEYKKGEKTGTLQVFVAGRYIVNVESHELTAEQFQKIADALPLKKLAELK